jgi:hypothetical protein
MASVCIFFFSDADAASEWMMAFSSGVTIMH